MITKLTKNQEAKLSEYRDKWLQIGLSTTNLSFDETKDIIDKLYINILKKDTVPVVILENPYKTWVAINQYYIQRTQVENQVRNQVRNQVENQVENQVRNQVRNQVENQVENQVGNQVWNQVWTQVENQVRTQVRNQVWNQVRDQRNMIPFIYPYLDGNLMSSYFSFYDYCLNELHVDIDKEIFKNFEIYKESSKLSLIYPLNDICFVCEKPIEIHFNENKVLHNETGASIKYKGDFEIYCLNGVKVDKKIVMTAKEKITVNQILKEQNSEIRRELLRKVGIDTFILKSKSKPIEISDDKIYELYKVKLGKSKTGMYLKMKNPSIDAHHFEGVADNCDTIEKALAWRDSEDAYIKPCVLT